MKKFGEKQHKIKYHKKIAKDIQKISQDKRTIIAGIIRQKLEIAPALFGKTLQNPLYPWKSLRVGDYRIVFEIMEDCVFIWGIAHRKEVYDVVFKRKSL